jgi:hypothetical protein
LVLVDSSVWIDFLSHKTSAVGEKLEKLIRDKNQVLVSGVVLQEVLQGIHNRRSYELTHHLLARFPFIMPDFFTHLQAAELFQTLTAKRYKPSTIDALIAALAIQNDITLFTLDKGFLLIQAHSDLQLY